MFTNFEKTIYNEYLKEKRKAKNQPFRPRKNFQNLNETTKLCLQRLAIFFNSNDTVSVTDFFQAPYKVYPEGENFDLKFYTTQKAKSVYKIYSESKQQNS